MHRLHGSNERKVKGSSTRPWWMFAICAGSAHRRKNPPTRQMFALTQNETTRQERMGWAIAVRLYTNVHKIDNAKQNCCCCRFFTAVSFAFETVCMFILCLAVNTSSSWFGLHCSVCIGNEHIVLLNWARPYGRTTGRKWTGNWHKFSLSWINVADSTNFNCIHSRHFVWLQHWNH